MNQPAFNMEDKLKLIADSFGRTRVKFNELLSEHTTLRVGGAAKLFFIAFTRSELIKMIKLTRELKVPFFLFGLGSKMMISDQGFAGVVIKNRTKNIKIVGVKGKVSKNGLGVDEALVEVDSGVSIKRLVEFLNQQELEAGELINLPGSVGGNLFLNRALRSKALTITILDQSGDIEEIEVNELNLTKHIILTGIFKFKSKGEREVYS